MKAFLKNTLALALVVSGTALAADPTGETTTSTAPAATAAPTGPISMHAKTFTKDQLATALQGVVDKINTCNGDTSCLKGVKEWNEAAMDSIKKLAVNFPAGQVLQLELLCGNAKTPKISPENISLDKNSLFTVNPPAKDCLVKGVNPKCGAIEHGKHYPELKSGETLYCVTGDDAKLKQSSDNLKTAVMNSMKKAMENSLPSKTPNSAPAATTKSS